MASVEELTNENLGDTPKTRPMSASSGTTTRPGSASDAAPTTPQSGKCFVRTRLSPLLESEGSPTLSLVDIKSSEPSWTDGNFKLWGCHVVQRACNALLDKVEQYRAALEEKSVREMSAAMSEEPASPLPPGDVELEGEEKLVRCQFAFGPFSYQLFK